MAESSKTEKATPKKRRDERKKGHVFLSQDAVSVVTLIGAWSMLVMLSLTVVEEIAAFLMYCFRWTEASGGSVIPNLSEIAEQEAKIKDLEAEKDAAAKPADEPVVTEPEGTEAAAEAQPTVEVKPVEEPEGSDADLKAELNNANSDEDVATVVSVPNVRI